MKLNYLLMEQVKWTERKFLFGYDQSYVPFLLERLRATAPRLEELAAECSEELAATDIANGWTIKEHIGHLTDLEILHDGRIDDFLEGMTRLRPADLSNKATYEAGHNNKTLDLLLKELDAVLLEKEKQMMVLAAELKFIKDWSIRVSVLRNEMDFKNETHK